MATEGPVRFPVRLAMAGSGNAVAPSITTRSIVTASPAADGPGGTGCGGRGRPGASFRGGGTAMPGNGDPSGGVPDGLEPGKGEAEGAPGVCAPAAAETADNTDAIAMHRTRSGAL